MQTENTLVFNSHTVGRSKGWQSDGLGTRRVEMVMHARMYSRGEMKYSNVKEIWVTSELRQGSLRATILALLHKCRDEGDATPCR